MKIEQKEKAFVPVTITLETEEEVKLLKELTSFVDDKTIRTLEKELNYEIEGDVTIGEIDDFSEELYDELYKII